MPHSDGAVKGLSLVLGPVTGNAYIEDEAIATFSGMAQDVNSRRSVAAADLDGDGYADLAVGAPESAGTQPGELYLFNGPLDHDADDFLADAHLTGPHGYSLFGSAGALPGDIDGDGEGDVLVTAEYDDTAGQDAGSTYLVLGPVSGESDVEDVFSACFYGPGDNANQSIGVGAGDTNGDGMIDILLGAEWADGEMTMSGAAWLLRGGGV